MTAIESPGFQIIQIPTARIWPHAIFFPFPKLKEHLEGKKFNSDERVKAEVKRS